MAQGSSGRVVLEIDPNLKKELYSVLAAQGITLKGWFLSKAKEYIANQRNKQITFEEYFSNDDRK